MDKFRARIPITIIGGFLGSGKTTLVNHLIVQGGRRFGVIVNEFGKTGVDGSLIENVGADGVAELSNGCLCCSGRDDLLVALVKLASREVPPKHVLVELSGVADPLPVAQTLLEPYVQELFELDSLIGVANAFNLRQTVEENPEGAVQLAYANTVVLNKTDLASSEQLEVARELLSGLNPLAEVHEAVRGVVPAHILHTGAFGSTPLPELEKVQHTKGLKSFTLRADRPLAHAPFDEFLKAMILYNPGNVYRTKGFVSLAGVDRRVLVQTVRDILNLSLATQTDTGFSELVVIGRELDKSAFEQRFARVAQLSTAQERPLEPDIDESDPDNTYQPAKQEQPHG